MDTKCVVEVLQIVGKMFVSRLDEISQAKLASALKLLALYSYGLPKFAKKFLKPPLHIEELVQQLTLKKSDGQTELAATITAFAAEHRCAKFHVLTSNMIVIGRLLRLLLLRQRSLCIAE